MERRGNVEDASRYRRDEDEPDVTASINVDDEIVRGTASVQ